MERAQFSNTQRERGANVLLHYHGGGIKIKLPPQLTFYNIHIKLEGTGVQGERWGGGEERNWVEM